jgi:hypothetical protein
MKPLFNLMVFFIRTDIIVKKGNSIKLIEVKAKSFNPRMKIYLVKMVACQDGNPICFDLQKYVAQKTPQFKFEAYLLMADKTKKASIDGLNKCFEFPKWKSKNGYYQKVHSLKETIRFYRKRMWMILSMALSPTI